MSEPVKKSSSIGAIFSEFMTRYPRHFGLLFLLLVVEGAAAAMSVLAIVPMADFLLDPSLGKPSRITQVVLRVFSGISMLPSFWLFGFFFVGLNLLKGTWQSNEEGGKLQRRFWTLNKPSELHGRIVSRIGAEFLRQHRDWLE